MNARVLVADDQQLVRAAFRMMLSAQADIEVVGEAADGREAVSLASSLRPDVVLMDIRMPELDGIEATRRIVALRNDLAPPRVLMLTTFDLDEYVYDALQAGASGFLPKDAPPDQLAAGVRTVRSVDALLAPSSTRRLIEQFVGPAATVAPPADLDELSPREREVFELLARGVSNREIAAQFTVAETTIKTDVARVLAKLGARDRIQAVVLAYQTGVVQPGRPPAQALANG
jgi:DNA-binding NarL/FixJ family response regulator